MELAAFHPDTLLLAARSWRPGRQRPNTGHGQKERRQWLSGRVRRPSIRPTPLSGLESLRTQIELRDLLASLGFRSRPVIGGDRHIDRRQNEQREKSADRHAGDDDQPDREAARRAAPVAVSSGTHPRPWPRSSSGSAAAGRGPPARWPTPVDPSCAASPFANLTIRMPCLLISPIRVSNPTCV